MVADYELSAQAGRITEHLIKQGLIDERGRDVFHLEIYTLLMDEALGIAKKKKSIELTPDQRKQIDELYSNILKIQRGNSNG